MMLFYNDINGNKPYMQTRTFRFLRATTVQLDRMRHLHCRHSFHHKTNINVTKLIIIGVGYEKELEENTTAIEEVVWALNSHDRLQCTLFGAILPGQGVFDFERCVFGSYGKELTCDYKLVTKLIQYIHMPLLLSKGAYTHIDKCTNRVLRT